MSGLPNLTVEGVVRYDRVRYGNSHLITSVFVDDWHVEDELLADYEGQAIRLVIVPIDPGERSSDAA